MPMTSDDLRRLLRDQALIGTPPRNPDRTNQIERRIARRRRRLRGQVAIVAAAVLAVAGGSVVATRGLSGDGGGQSAATRTATPSPPRKVKLPPAVSIEKLWPRAVKKLPARLPNGRTYSPVTLVDEHTLLATTSSSFEKTDAVWSYDTATRRLERVTRISTPPHATTFASDFAVGDGQVAWWTARRQKGETVAEIWSAPLSGGQVRKVTTMPAGRDADGGIERLVISGGRVIWSLSTFSPGARAGIFTAPLTGGEPSEISGSDGYHILDWPWVGTPGGRVTSPNGVGFKDLRNMATGEQRTAELGPGSWTCGLTWCVGGTARGLMLVRRDGSEKRVLPRDVAPMLTDLALDRFLLIPRAKTIQLYDLRSGRLADLGSPNLARSFRPFSAGGRLYFMERADGYLVVDLTAIR